MAQALDPVQARPTKSGAPPVELGWTVYPDRYLVLPTNILLIFTSS